MYRVVILVVTTFFVAMANLALAQHDYPAVEVQRGGQFFRGNCAGCHGQDGNLIDGVSLADPLFLQSITDEQLIRIVIEGIPGTTMLPSDYSDLQAGNIVAYLRDMAEQGRIAPIDGDAERGQALVESQGCLGCHRIDGSGSRVGPDLSMIGLIRRTSDLEDSILNPNATILPENRYIRIVTGNGATMTGRLLNHDRVTVQMIDSNERLQSHLKAGLVEFTFIEDSSMPSFADRLSGQELEDVLSYLVSLTGGDTQ